MQQTRTFSQQVFRANDIRGDAEQALSNEFTAALGQVFGAKVSKSGEPKIMICRDARLSSPRLHRHLVRGLQTNGLDIVDLGVGPTPLLGFALAKSKDVHSGIMITASHNPANENGFKFVLNGLGFYGDDLKDLHQEMQVQERINLDLESDLKPAPEPTQHLNLDEDYIQALKTDIGSLAGLKVVVDGGHGATGPLSIKVLEALDIDVIGQFCTPDGSFPNRSPDTSNPENLRSLKQRVIQEGAFAGIGFDGDGDRMVAVTNTGRLLDADQLISLFAQSALAAVPQSSIVYDVKCSSRHSSQIKALGGTAVMHRSGRSYILAKMLETDASFAGEFSAHYFFRDRWYGTDDGIYAACRLLQICKEQNRSLDQICQPISGKVATDEIYLGVPEDKKHQIVSALPDHCDFKIQGQTPTLIDIDGVRLEYDNGWALIRVSNTSAALTLRFEANSQEFMTILTNKVADMLKRIHPTIDTDGIQHVS